MKEEDREVIVASDERTRNNAGTVLKAYVERIERLNEEADAINSDKSDLYKEAKGNGFDVKALKEIIRLRKQDPSERQERDAILETYMQALGML